MYLPLETFSIDSVLPSVVVSILEWRKVVFSHDVIYFYVGILESLVPFGERRIV